MKHFWNISAGLVLVCLFIGWFAEHRAHQEELGTQNNPGYTGVTLKPPAPKTAEEVTRKLTYCILPKAQYGKYSSYDGGKSAVALLERCPDETLEWIDSCQQHGQTKDKCNLDILTVAQVAIKSFGK